MSDELEHVVVEGLDEIGFDLVELRRVIASRPVLEVRIDRRDGEKVTVDDCARASRALEARLDSSALVAERYVLQVSSPGERPLRTPDEWRRFVGRWANVLAPEFGGRFEAVIGDVDERGARRSSRCVPSVGRRSGFRSPRSRRRGWRFASNKSECTGCRFRRALFREVLDGQFRRDVGRVPRALELEAARSYGALWAAAGRHPWPRWRRSTAPPCRRRSTSTTRSGEIRIVLLKTVVEAVEDPAREIALEEAKIFDEGFEPGDVMEEPLDFTVFGRAAVQAAKQRIIQRVREGERTKIRDEFASPRRRPALAARSSRSSAASSSSCSTSSARRRRSSRIASRTIASISIRASRFAPCSSASRRRPRARG